MYRPVVRDVSRPVGLQPEDVGFFGVPAAKSVANFMRKSPLITPAYRDHLRRLKSDFDAACAAVEDFSDRNGASFRTAQDLYRTWIKAIDGAALALLNDLDALDGADSEASEAARFSTAHSPVEAIRPGEVDHVFAEIDDALHARAIVSAADDDDMDLFGA